MIGLAEEIYSAGGDAEAVVGVQYFKATKEHPPIRLFYPADESSIPSTSRPVRWFEDTGVLPFLKGYSHMAFSRKETRVFWYILVPFLTIISLFFPVRWLRIPGVYKNAPIKQTSSDKKKLPVIVFSHGLSGTGQENKALCAQWAKQGFIVASVHHTDGSSCHVTLEDGSELYYRHGPPLSDYDPTFRPLQLRQRAKELLQTHAFVFSEKGAPAEIRERADPKRIVAAGYSYGAATAASAVTMDKTLFRGALFLDGWFHIDVRESAGVELKLPQEAFEPGGFPPNFATCFINSEQFQKIEGLFATTKELAGDDNKIHVIPGTGHQNFCEVVFWFYDGFVRKLAMGAVGPTNPTKAYKEIVDLSTGFLKKVVDM
jgi:predicted esterase